MKLDTAEHDQGYFQPVNRRVDQSIGMVLTGLCVILFFMVFLLSILQFQAVTSQPTIEPAREPIRPAGDIGGNITVEQEPAPTDTIGSQ